MISSFKCVCIIPVVCFHWDFPVQIQMTVLSPPKDSDSVAEKLLSYNRANRAVAILCNHQRAPPKTFDQSMANLQAKVRTA